MKTKPIIATSVIFVLVLFSSLLFLTRETASAGATEFEYSVCCRNVDGYCLDLFEPTNNHCGENNIFVSKEFCYMGNVPECEAHCCYINGVLQRVSMSKFECEKAFRDSGASSWNWDPNCS